MDSRLKNLADQLDAGLIARREFLKKAAVITGGTAAGLHALRGMAPAQAKTKLRVWLFKSFVTAGNDVVSRQIEAWAKDKNVEVEMDWATFGDREQKFVAAIEAGNPPDMAEMNIYGPMRYKAALRDVTKVASDIAGAKGVGMKAVLVLTGVSASDNYNAFITSNWFSYWGTSPIWGWLPAGVVRATPRTISSVETDVR